MAGFEVIIYGRFWVIAEARAEPVGAQPNLFHYLLPAILQQAAAKLFEEDSREGVGRQLSAHCLANLVTE
jgi:hypothetical protein